jgi:hypothetical protein
MLVDRLLAMSTAMSLARRADPAVPYPAEETADAQAREERGETGEVAVVRD